MRLGFTQVTSTQPGVEIPAPLEVAPRLILPPNTNEGHTRVRFDVAPDMLRMCFGCASDAFLLVSSNSKQLELGGEK